MQPVALDRVADLELHHRHAGQLAPVRPEPARSSSMVLRISPTTALSSLLLHDRGIEREHDQRERAVVRQQLAADDLVRFARARSARRRRRPCGNVSGNSAAGNCPASGGWRAENSEIRPRTPSISCRSVTMSRSLLERIALEQVRGLDRHQHVEFGRRETLRHLFILLEFRRVGAEQLAERIVDLDPHDAETGGDR